MYCPDCGAKLSLKFCENEGLVPYCNDCGEFKFPPFKTAVSMVTVNKAQDRVHAQMKGGDSSPSFHYQRHQP